jgi:hypothetical protein
MSIIYYSYSIIFIEPIIVNIFIANVSLDISQIRTLLHANALFTILVTCGRLINSANVLKHWELLKRIAGNNNFNLGNN